MSLKDVQKDVESWVSQYKLGYFKPLEIMSAITEEVGELAKEINNRFGPRNKKSPEDTNEMSEEIADIIFNLTCMANSNNIDLEKAWKGKMDKCYGRDKDRFDKK
ncbi:MAG: nucleotide pyrophosphohydrolase [Candidatus Pacearchaeota archaeon]